MRKKGSLNLSIETIVVVVIAFTVLGLGLGFVKGMIGDVSGTSEKVLSETSQHILDDLRSSNKKLSFPTDKLSLLTGQESVQAIGIKNTGDGNIWLKVGFQVKDGSGFIDFPEVGSLDLPSNTGTAKIIWDAEAQYLAPGESKLVKITITAPSKQGNYLYKIVVTAVENPNAPPSATILGPYDTQTFFIKTS